MNSIEAQRRLFRNIRTMENKIRGGSTTQVTITIKRGGDIKYTETKDIKRRIAKSTENKRHQKEGSSELIKEDLMSKLGNYGEEPDVHKLLNGTFISPEGTVDATKDFYSM